MRNLIKEFQAEIQDSPLDSEQKGIADVVAGKSNSTSIRKGDLSLLSDIVTLESGHYRFGAKHILVDHYSGRRGSVTAQEILDMGRIIRDGKMKAEDGKHIYEWRDAGNIRFRVIVAAKEEKVITFYSNRK